MKYQNCFLKEMYFRFSLLMWIINTLKAARKKLRRHKIQTLQTLDIQHFTAYL